MINRCKYCNDICPDFSEICDTCAYIEAQDKGIDYDEPREEEITS